MRTIGKVKWFDPAAGEGCVLSDGGTQAALTRAVLEPFGLDAIDAGVALVYDMKLEAGRLVVGVIHEIAGNGPNTAASAGKQPGTVQRVKGRVQWFDRAKGYGFVVSKDVNADILLHRSVLEAIGIDALAQGAVLEFDLVRKLKGPQVTRIHAVLAPDQPLLPPVEPPLSGGSIVIGPRLVDRLTGSKPPRTFDLSEVYYGRAKGFGFIAREDDAPVWEDAVCRWFSRPKGFGFLRLVEGDGDVFVHMDLLRRSGIRELKPGQRVRVETERTARGLTAVVIELDWDDDAGHA